MNSPRLRHRTPPPQVVGMPRDRTGRASSGRHDPRPALGTASAPLLTPSTAWSRTERGWERSRKDRRQAQAQGSFTRPALGIAIHARALAQARALPLVGVGTLEAIRPPRCARDAGDRRPFSTHAARGRSPAAGGRKTLACLAPHRHHAEALAASRRTCQEQCWQRAEGERKRDEKRVKEEGE